jgi:hypothetical protein
MERWSGVMVDRTNRRLGHFGDLACARRRIFGPTGHGSLAQVYLGNRHLTRRALKGLKSCLAGRICGALVLTPLLRGGVQKKNSPGVNPGLRFLSRPLFRGRGQSELPGVQMPFLAFARRNYAEQVTNRALLLVPSILPL